MKKCIILTLLFFAFTAVGFASPLTDYSQGKLSMDIALWTPDITGEDSSGSVDYDAKSGNIDMTITCGINEKTALQYRLTEADTKTYSIDLSGYGIVNGNGALLAHEVNLLYKVKPNVSAFAGVAFVKNDIDTSIGTVSGDRMTGLQIGVMGTNQLTEKTTAYGSLSFGDVNNVELGISQAISDNWDFNLYYRSVKYKDLEFKNVADYQYDYKVKGLGFGLTYRY